MRLPLPIPEGLDQLGLYAVSSTLPVVHINFLFAPFEKLIEPGVDALHVLDAIAGRSRILDSPLHLCFRFLFRPLGHALRGFYLPNTVPTGKALSGFLHAASLHQSDEVDDVTALLPTVIRIAGLGEAAPIVPVEINGEAPGPVALLVRWQRTGTGCIFSLVSELQVVLPGRHISDMDLLDGFEIQHSVLLMRAPCHRQERRWQ